MDESTRNVGRLNLSGRYEVLEILDTVPSARCNELISKINVSAATVFNALKDLKKFGLVEHENKKGYSITPKGRKIRPVIQKIKSYLQ